MKEKLSFIRPEMSGLGDSLTVGIILTLIFGAVCFYLYSRMNQNEKRVGLLENLLMSLKISTEASMMGPDMVEPISNPAPLAPNDVEQVSEESYADMLKEIDAVATEEKELLRSLEPVMEAEVSETSSVSPSIRKMDANYESMSSKELQALARQRGISGVPLKKRDLIDALKKQGESAPAAPEPLIPVEGELEGVDAGFSVDLQKA